MGEIQGGKVWQKVCSWQQEFPEREISLTMTTNGNIMQYTEINEHISA